MSVELHFNGQRTSVKLGSSLFDYAETLGINVPTSCQKNGKCKECVVEVVEGMERLSKPVPAEKHLRDNFRLSCSCKIISDSGVVRCHTMRRGEMKNGNLIPPSRAMATGFFWTAKKSCAQPRRFTGWRWIWERQRL